MLSLAHFATKFTNQLFCILRKQLNFGKDWFSFFITFQWVGCHLSFHFYDLVLLLDGLHSLLFSEEL